MEKEAKKAVTKTKNTTLKSKVKNTAAAVVIAATVSSCDLNPKELKAAQAKKYDMDWFEVTFGFWGSPQNNIKPTGDKFKDLCTFLLGQGGGLSKDPQDMTVWKWVNGVKIPDPTGWATEAHEDGFKYHTSKDITWKLYKSLAPKIGYKATSEDFYEMSDERRNSIVQYHIDLASTCSSNEMVNFAAVYPMWGTGSYKGTKERFEQFYGDIEVNIRNKGEYYTFSRFLACYREELEANNQKQWNRYGKGWSAGIANFHRIFKVYC